MTTTAEQLAHEWGTVIPFAGYDMENPQVWEKYGSEWVEFPTVSGDVYITLKHFAELRADVPTELTPDCIAMFTTGFAAPIDDCVDEDGEPSMAPSKSKNRRRIALGVFVSRDTSRCSVMNFEDNKDEPIYEASGTGALAEALDLCALSTWGAEYLARLSIIAVDESNGLNDEQRNELKHRVGFMLNSAELIKRDLEN